MATTPTAAQAQDLMWRSMTTGASNAEFDKYGGYDAVAAAYKAAGGGFSRDEIPAAQKTQLAQQIANTGVGNLGLLADTGVALTEAGRTAMTNNGVDFGAAQLDARGIPYQKTTSEQLTGMQRQLAELQTAYDTLAKRGPVANLGTSPSGITAGGSTVSAGGTTSAASPVATTGVVYGPDGTMYSSAAAAIAAGVQNYTTTKPAGAIAGANTLSNQFVNASKASTGNVNPGGLIGNAQQQLFKNPVGVQKPTASVNPFATTPS